MLIRNLTLVTVLACSACSVKTIQHPGALNSFDNFAYDSLRVEEAAIKQAKVDVAQFPAAKPALVAIVKQYDTTSAAYKVYHRALAAGQNPSNAALQTEINSLITDLASLFKQMVPPAPSIPNTGK